MAQKRTGLNMTLKAAYGQRSRFHRAPEATDQEELPLLEKQALVDEILRGMPITQSEMYTDEKEGSVVYMVTKGWAQLQAIFDFMDNKFPTWDEEGKRRWEQLQA